MEDKVGGGRKNLITKAVRRAGGAGRRTLPGECKVTTMSGFLRCGFWR